MTNNESSTIITKSHDLKATNPLKLEFSEIYPFSKIGELEFSHDFNYVPWCAISARGKRKSFQNTKTLSSQAHYCHERPVSQMTKASLAENRSNPTLISFEQKFWGYVCPSKSLG